MITSKFIRFAYVAVALCAAVCVKVCVGAEVPQVTGTKPADMEQRFYPVSDGFPYRIREAAEGVGEASNDFHACFRTVLGLFDVEWPDGSLSVNVKALGGVRVLNTPQNHAKIEAALNVLDAKPHTVELDCRFVEAGREALAAAGYFATNRVDGATLLSRLMAHDGVKVLAAPRMIGRNGEEIISKHVKRIRYPQDYDVLIDEGTSNTVRRTSAVAVEPQNFEEREVGVTVVATPTILEDGNVRVHLEAKLVDEPEWKDFGVKAAWEGAASYDLVMEQPMFPERLSLDAYLSLNLGETVVIGGVTDSREKNEGRFVFLFVTARVTNGEGTDMTPKMGKWRSCAKDGMEARTYVVLPPILGCSLRADDEHVEQKTPEEIVEEAAMRTREWKEFLTEVAHVEWPSGSDVHYLRSFNLLWVKTTPLNFDKLENGFLVDGVGSLVEMDFRILEAGREALDATGYFATNRVDGATLLSRLMARDDVKLLEAPRVAVTDNSEVTMKGLMLYRYPQDFDVMIGTGAEPQNFKEQEVGTILTVTPTLIRTSEKFFDLAVNFRLDGTPEWKNYGADAKWKKAKAYDLKMEQPFFRERVNIDSHVTVKPGTTVLLGGGADAPDGRSKAVLVFVTPRLAGKLQP